MKMFLPIIGIIFLSSFLTANNVGAYEDHNQTQIVSLVNKYRTVPLTLDLYLSVIAQRRAEDMVSKNYFSHVSPEGKRAWDFLKDYNYSYLVAGENLAIQFKTDKGMVNAWMLSPSHRRNIVNPAFSKTGIGVAGKGRKAYVVQLFSN